MARLLAAALSMAVLVAAVVTVLWLVLASAVVLGAFHGGRWVWRQHQSRLHDRAELLARADIQHRWYLAGDPRGTYGRYPPAMHLQPNRVSV